MNTADNLIMMANQIARNLARERDPAAATAEHIRLYWDPRMRRAIAGLSRSRLDPVAAAALDLLAEK